MTASPNIKTPAMEVSLYRSAQAQAKGEELKKHFTRVSLDQVSFSQVSLDQVSFSQVSLDQVSLDQVSLDQVSLDQVSLNPNNYTYMYD